MSWPGAIALGLLLTTLCVTNGAAQDAASSSGSPQPGANYEAGPAELSAFSLLTIARTALRDLESEQREVDRRASYYSAISGLTGLYQLHGCAWALPKLVELHSAPDCPEMHLGYSEDGRFSVRVELLELQNPRFSDYAVLLVTLESNTSLTLELVAFEPMRLELGEGDSISAEPVTPQHPLWNQLDRLAPTFEPKPRLPSGTTFTFKQLYAMPAMETGKIRQVGLGWRDYKVEVPFYENLTGDGRREENRTD